MNNLLRAILLLLALVLVMAAAIWYNGGPLTTINALGPTAIQVWVCACFVLLFYINVATDSDVILLDEYAKQDGMEIDSALYFTVFVLLFAALFSAYEYRYNPAAARKRAGEFSAAAHAMMIGLSPPV